MKGTEQVVHGRDLEIGTGALWLPYKTILEAVTQAIEESSAEAFSELESSVRKHKPDFTNFLAYKTKSSSDREMIKKAVSEGIYLRGQESKQYLNAQLVNETIYISDMYNINEFLSLDLLVTAESLKEEYPGWGRGLIAVLLYYEGRYSMIQAVSIMVRTIPGLQWRPECYPRICQLFQTVLSYVFRDDMIDNLLELYSKSDVKSQLELLDANLALGDWRHRFEINKLLTFIRDGITFIIFAQAAQNQFSWKDTLRLLEYLKTVRLDTNAKFTKAENYLIGAVMFAIYNNLSFPDYNKSYALELQKYIKENEKEEGGFACFELLGFIKLNYYILNHKAVSETNINSAYAMDSFNDITKDDEEFTFKKDIFHFLRTSVFLDSPLFSEDEVLTRRYHELFVDFITYMPLKVKEMKSRSEEAAKTAMLYKNQGFPRPPNLPQDYENFLECLGQFYSHDINGLSRDFFEQDVKNLAINKVARTTCIDSPTLFVSNARFLIGLATGSPDEVFELLKQTGHGFSFDHFFDSIMKYLLSFGDNQPTLPTTLPSTAVNRDVFNKVVMDSMRISITPSEIDGICVYLDLVKTVCDGSDRITDYFTHQKLPWIRTMLTTSKVRAIPREVRAKMVCTAASMISKNTTPDVIIMVWDMFYNVKLLGQENGDFKDELEEHESRLEEYPLTISMLKLLGSLVEARFGDDDTLLDTDAGNFGQLDYGAFDKYVQYVRDHVLQKAFFRGYKTPEERWEITTRSVEILSKLLDYTPQLIFQLLCSSPFLKSVLNTIADCIRIRESTTGVIEPVDRCGLACLNLLRRGLLRQKHFRHRRDLLPGKGDIVIVGLQELLMKIVPETGRPEYILAILKYIDTLQSPDHRKTALDILALTLTDRDDIDSHLYASLVNDSVLISRLRYMFVNILYDGSVKEDMKKSVLQIVRVSAVHSAPNIGLMLLGVDKRIDFQNAGVGGYPRTVLHAILDNSQNLPDAFLTLLVLLRDTRLWNPLLRYLKTNHFFAKFLRENVDTSNLEAQDFGNLLKCMAIELKNSSAPGPLAETIIADESGKFQDILHMIEPSAMPLTMPDLEFFDTDNVMQAMRSCEYYDLKAKIRVIHVDILANRLKDEITKMEKTTPMRLRHTVQLEAKQITEFAKEHNNRRLKEASKVTLFEGWRQCLEVLVLGSATLNLAGVDFVTSILRVLLIKITGTNPRAEFLCRLGAETILTLSAVLTTLKHQVNATTLNVITGYMCKWISEEPSFKVRATLYASILHILQMFKNFEDAGVSATNAFSIILDNLGKDCCQSREIGKIQAMYVMGEIVKLTSGCGLGGHRQSLNMSTDDTSLKNVDSYPMTYASPAVDQSLLGAGDGLPTRSTMDSPGVNSRRFHSTTIKHAYHRMESIKSNTNVMNFIRSKGFLGNLIDAIPGADDHELTQLFIQQNIQAHLKSLFVFEAKMSLLSCFAATGKKPLLYLLDTNVISKLADMKVLGHHYFYEDMKTPIKPVSMQQDSFPSRKEIMERLFSSILKFLHALAGAAPKNILLIQEVWKFLSFHDMSLSSLLSSYAESDESVGRNLLVSLLAKVARHMPMEAFTSNTDLMSQMRYILKRQAAHPTYALTRLRVVKDSLQFFHNYCHNSNLKLDKPYGKGSGFRPCLTSELNHDMLTSSTDNGVSVGVVVKVVCDVATVLSQQSSVSVESTQSVSVSINLIEIGLYLAYCHIQAALVGSLDAVESFTKDVATLVDDRIVKVCSDAGKISGNPQFIDALLLRLRRIVHSSRNQTVKI